MIHSFSTPDSSMLQLVTFNDTIMQLEVLFRNGKVYQYTEVPYSAYIEFKNAPSAGSHYNSKIKGYYSHPQQ